MSMDLSDEAVALAEGTEEETYLLKAARIGIDVSVFKRSPGGKHLYDLAMKDVQDNLFVLLDEELLDSDNARRAHANARKAAAALDYMATCISAGEVAENELASMDLEDQHE